MEKLIELLNEYKKIKWYDWNTEITNYDTDTGSFTNGYSWLEYEIVIGKRYWFIKWLVEEDKIDFSLIPNKIKEIWIPMKINWEIKYWFDSSDYYWLLMLLAISDTPIEDLISYLK